MTWQDDAGRDLVRSFGERMALFVRGEGAYLWDADGKRYLDFLAGIAVDSLGHAHPAFVEAISSQAATLAHVSNYFATTPQLELAARLKRLAGTGDSGRVYFGNSGACTAAPTGPASSRSRTPSTAARWARSRSPASRTCRSRSCR